MDENNFIIRIVLEAINNTHGAITALASEIEALKRAGGDSSRGGATADIQRGLDETGRAARDAEKDVRSHRQETERATSSTRAHSAAVSSGKRSLDDYSRSAKDAGDAQEALAKRGQELLDSVEDLNRSIASHRTMTQQQRVDAQRLAEDLQKLSRSYKATSDGARLYAGEADNLRQTLSRDQERVRQDIALSGQHVAAINRVAEAHTKQLEAQLKASAHDQASKQAIQDLIGRYRSFRQEMDAGNVSRKEIVRGLQDFGRELKSLSRSFDAGSAEAMRYGRMADEAIKQSRQSIPETDSAVAKLANRFDDWGLKIISASAALRGIALAAVVGLAQQLDSALVGMAGALVAVASAAAMAAAGLGGAFVSALEQAIPAATVFLAVVERVKVALDAAKQAQQAAQQKAVDATTTANQQAGAQDALINAQNGLKNSYTQLADAQHQVVSSQLALTDARRAAARQIVDLVLAEKEAQLAALGASLTLTQAQQQLQRTVLTGQTGTDLTSSQLQVEQARLGVTRAAVNLPRAEEDAARAQRLGVGGAPGVVSATQGLMSARQSVSQARAGITSAQLAAEQARRQQAAASQGVAAARQLDYTLSHMDATEKRLFTIFVNLEKLFQGPNTPLSRATDAILRPFANGLQKVYDILSNPHNPVTQALNRLGTSVGGALDQLERQVFSKRGMKFFTFMADEASKNLPVIINSFGHIASILQDIGVAAAPVLRFLVDGFNGWIADLDKKLSSPGGMKSLSDFFKSTIPYIQSFMHLFSALAGLLASIISDAAPSGKNIIDSLTNSINQATTWVQQHGPEVRQFFHQAADVISALGTLILKIAQAMVSLFDPELVRTFVNFFTTYLLPALADALHVLGFVVNAVMEFFNLFGAPGRKVLEFFAAGITALLIFGKAFDPIKRAFTGLIGLVIRLGKIWEAFKLAYTAFKLGDIGGAIAAIKEGFSKATTGQAAEMETAIVSGGTKAAEAMGAAVTEAGVKAAEALSVAMTEGGTAAGAEIGAAEVSGGAAVAGEIAGAEVAGAAGVGGAAAVEGAAGAGLGGAAVGAGVAGEDIVAGAAGSELGLGVLGPLGLAVGGGLLLSTLLSGGSAKVPGFSAQQILSGSGQLNKQTLGVSGPDNASQIADVLATSSTGSDLTKQINQLASPNASDTVGSSAAISAGTQGYLSKFIPTAQNVDLIHSSTRALHELRQRAQELERLPDVTAKQRAGLRNLISQLSPANVEIKKAGVLWGATFDGINATTGNVVKQVQAVLKTDIKNISDNLGTGTTKGATAFAATITSAYQTILNNTSLTTKGVRQGIQQITDMLNKALKAVGAEGKGQQISLQQFSALGAENQQQLLTGHVSVGGITSPHAKGGFEPARPGGKVIQVAEGGYPEVVLTTDPKHANRQRALLSQYLRQAPHVLGYATGGMVFPFPSNEPFTWERVDQGQDLLGPAGGPVLAIAPGVVSQASDRFGGFGPYYPTEQITEGPLAGRGVYYGHTKISRTGRVNAGDVIAHTQPTANDWTAAPAGWLELGFLPYGSMTAGQAIAPILHELASGHRVIATGAAALGAAAQAVWHNIRTPHLSGAAGAIGEFGQGVLSKVTSAYNAYGRNLLTGGSVSLGGTANIPGSGVIVGASEFGPPGVDPTVHDNAGAYGANFPGSVARLKSGGSWFDQLPPHSRVRLGADTGKSIVAEVMDWGTGGGSVQGHPRVLDLWWQTANMLGLPGSSGRWSGLLKMQKAATGFHGVVNEPTMFLTGEAGQELVNITPAQSGGFFSSDMASGGGGGGLNLGIVELIRSITSGLGKVMNAVHRKNFTSRLIHEVDNLTRQDGVLDQLSTAIDDYISSITSRLTRAAYHINRRGEVALRENPAQQSANQVLGLEGERRQLRSESRVVGRAQGDVLGRLSRLLGIPQRRLRHFTPSMMVKALNRANLKGQDKTEATSLVTEFNNLYGRANDIRDKLDQNLTDTYSAESQGLQNQISQIANVQGAQATDLQTTLGQEQTLGTYGMSSGGNITGADITAKLINNAQDQISKLRPIMARALRQGNTDQAVQIQQQIDSLQSSITDMTSTFLAAQISWVDQQAQYAQSHLQRQARIADVIAKGATTLPGGQLGTTVAAQMQMGVLEQTRSNIQDQISSYNSLLGQAQASGNVQAQQQLLDKIDELTTQLVENTQAISDQTVTIRQTMIDFINARSQFMTGIFGSLYGAVQTIGQLTGGLDVKTATAVTGANQRVLTQTGAGLASQLSDLTGGQVNLQGLSGMNLINAITKIPFDQIEAGMTAAQKSQFEGLVSSITNNEAALEQNTVQLQTLNGQLLQPQQWSTTTWSNFRAAFFTGMGQLLPQFSSIPNMSNGGAASMSPSTTSMISAPAETRSREGGWNGDLYVTSPTEVADPDYFGRRVAWHMKTSP